MLSKYFYKIKGWLKGNENDFFTALIIILTAVAAFGLGRLSAVYDAKTPLVIKNAAIATTTTIVQHSTLNNPSIGNRALGEYLASKNGKKYYPAGCPAAMRIAEANRLWFASASEAEAAGFTLTVSCN